MDDILVVDTAVNPTGNYSNVAESRHRLRLQYTAPASQTPINGSQTFAYSGGRAMPARRAGKCLP